MRSVQKTIIQIIFLAIMLLLWGMGWRNIATFSADQNIGTAGLRYEEPVWNIKQIKHILLNSTSDEQEEPLAEFVAWTEGDSVSVSDQFTGRSATAEVIKTYGNVPLLIQNTRIVNGNALVLDDIEGCMVSTTLAEKIWGGSSVADLPLEIGNDEYIVRGVFEGTENVFLRQDVEPASGSDAAVFDSVEVSLKNINGVINAPQEQITKFTNATGLAKPSATILSIYTYRFLQALLGLPALFFCIIFCVVLFRRKKYFSHHVLGTFIPMLLTVYAIGIFLFLIKDILFIPREYLPTEWSNFNFWDELIQQIQTSTTNLFIVPSNSFDLERRTLVLKTVGLVIGTLFAIFPATMQRYVLRDTKAEWIMSIEALLACTAITIWFSMPYQKTYWLTVPVFFAGLLVLNYMQSADKQMQIKEDEDE